MYSNNAHKNRWNFYSFKSIILLFTVCNYFGSYVIAGSVLKLCRFDLTRKLLRNIIKTPPSVRRYSEFIKNANKKNIKECII